MKPNDGILLQTDKVTVRREGDTVTFFVKEQFGSDDPVEGQVLFLVEIIEAV